MERKWDPHTCGGCGARFEVGYDEDLQEAPPALADVVCPRCGKLKGLYVPEGAEADLAVELADEDEEVDEGAGD